VSQERLTGERVKIRHISPATILIAEDNQDDAFFLERAFSRVGPKARLQFVRDGQEAIEYLQGSEPFDDRATYPFPELLVLDLRMPRLTGFEVIEWVRANPLCRELPIVVLTGSDAPRDLKSAYALGANACLPKPDDANLIPIVERLEREWLSHLFPQAPPQQ
jgi:CheY-like chemotaxis protein